ncbi:DEAD/DEAH box helicase [Paenimyroides aestuarii]|uniref:DEAD/DEAH box helicase n=1 Tax=Paenimyroides aestuarii TaxID=2968490 RepID=A0ABY5NVS9_9FLAO|nr:DEAD/DEAH box helicase [Paenimyroides aestuarii]UUV22650.1 DEAD/DEAH box helicase [Paenimyroides aestuarii]
MYRNSFAKFIQVFSTDASRNNAFYVRPDFVAQQDDCFIYEYLGGSNYPYVIEIELNEMNDIYRVECSCPYDYEGICKHIIASIEDLAQRLDSGSLSTKTVFLNVEENAKELEHADVTLTKGSFNLEELKKRVTKNTMSNGWVHYIDLNFYHIKTQINSWNTSKYVQEIILIKDQNKLKTTCNCTKQQVFCEHLLLVFKDLANKYGVNFFSDDFINQKIEKELTLYGLTTNDDYQEFFDVKLSSNGVFLQPKPFVEIDKYSNALVRYAEDAETAARLNLPAQNIQEEPTGLALCVDYNSYYSKKNYVSFYGIKGKFNKEKTDFTAKIKRLFSEDLEHIIDEFPRSSDFQFAMDAIRTERLLNERNIGSRRQAIEIFNSFFQDSNKPLFFLRHELDSYARKNLTPLEICSDPIKLHFQANSEEKQYKLQVKVELSGTKYKINSTKILVTPLFVILETKVYPIQTPKLSFDLMHFAEHPEMKFYKKNGDYFYKEIVLPLSKDYHVSFSELTNSKIKIAEETLEKHLYINDIAEGYVVFKPFVKYNDDLIPLYSNEAIIRTEGGQLKKISRNEAFEDNFLEELRKLHPDFAQQDAVFYLQPEQLLENYWLMTVVEKMKSLDILVFGANNLKSFKFNVHKPTISIRLESDIDWFDVLIDVKFGEQSVNLKDLQKAFIKQSNYVLLKDGTTGILPKEWMQKFALYFQTGEVKKNSIQLSNYQFGIIDELYNELHNKPAFFEELYQKKQRLLNIKNIPNVKVPKEIKATLRHYQHEGLNWLAFLDENKLGGCLADDMGLGKTLQTITFLQYLKNKDKKAAPTLIIAPTSLIFNWQSEIKKFCPSLKALAFVGSNRMEHRKDIEKYDIVLSTYGSLLNDVTFLKEINFNYLILDESQAIKNPASKRYKAVRLLNAKNRLVLTGTPIENNTFDLYAQLNFVNPGLLGTMTHFRKDFSDYIDKQNDAEVSKTLSRIINPFVLRRTKEQVAPELPEKIESVIYCEMDTAQRKVYDAFKNRFREYILNQIEENGVANSQMYILEGLTKLRQICNSTALINEEESYGNYSVKLDTLTETIKEKTGNHKILVFSQFVGMLQLIKERLDSEQIVYEYLDGSTQNRQEKVESFQNNQEVRVFLISLKAGGTGLNLTEADYVFIVDPWWNPAVENQAIDRSYRIGQQKKVMAYRLICKDTIEEKIVTLQNKKKSVASAIISIDEKQKSFNVADIKHLFS